jgi:hypothetical protein
MTAGIEVLRSYWQPSAAGAGPAARLKVTFLGRDGPDFSSCPFPLLPELEPGQVLLLPLSTNREETSQPWRLIGAGGYGMTTRVTSAMRAASRAARDSRLFIVREIVNSLSRGDPVARFEAARLVATQAGYLEPELTAQLQNSIGRDSARWAQVLANMLLSYPGRTLTLSDIRAGKTEPDWPDFKGFPLAQLALNHLSTTNAEMLVWQSLIADLAGFTDEPYHPLFAYNGAIALHAAVAYLMNYRHNSTFLEAVRKALRQDVPGSSFLAARLIDEGQSACLREALNRAMKVVRRPAADGDDVSSAVGRVLRYGTNNERRQLAAFAAKFQKTNPDYSTFLERRIAQSSRKHPAGDHS